METYRMFEIKENIERRKQIPHLTVEEIRKRINEIEERYGGGRPYWDSHGSDYENDDSYYYNDLVSTLGNRIKEALSYSMGADLHETWRQTRRKEDGTYEPRMKKSKDERWNKEHGTDDVDIANLTFEELPSNWQYENLEAARVAIDEAYSFAIKPDEISKAVIENLSSDVHEAWLKRNDWVYDPEYGNPDQAKPYKELSEKEKAKDRVQIMQAIEKVKAFKRGEIDIDKIKEQYGLVHKEEEVLLEKNEAELSALEEEEKTISETEALIDKQAEKSGEQK